MTEVLYTYYSLIYIAFVSQITNNNINKTVQKIIKKHTLGDSMSTTSKSRRDIFCKSFARINKGLVVHQVTIMTNPIAAKLNNEAAMTDFLYEY